MLSTEKKGGPVSAGATAKNTLIVLAIVVTALFIWQIKEALLFAFAGMIFAVILTGFARTLEQLVPISRVWSLSLVGGMITLLAVLFIYTFGKQIVNQFEEFTEKFPEQISQVQERIREWPLGRQLLDGKIDSQDVSGQTDNQKDGNEQNNDDQDSSEQEDADQTGNDDNGVINGMSSGAGGVLSKVGITIVDIFSSFLLILVTGIYFTINPKIYTEKLILLFPKKRAARINEAMETAGNALWDWLKGQLVAMIFVGISTTIGLMIIGVPLALILGFMAGLADFVPIVGPLVAFIPAVLLAVTVGPEAVIYTVLLFLAIQQAEGNIITPLIQRRMVKIAPAYLLLSLVAFGSVFGAIGVILAAPIAVVLMVFVGMFYVEDVLGKEATIPGRE